MADALSYSAEPVKPKQAAMDAAMAYKAAKEAKTEEKKTQEEEEKKKKTASKKRKASSGSSGSNKKAKDGKIELVISTK